MTSTAHNHHGDAHHRHDSATPGAQIAPDSYWEDLYTADGERKWSGRVNATIADIAADLEPARSLDLGSGEGGDVIWFAKRGWRSTGIDISPTAVERATALAADADVDPQHVTFLAGDLFARLAPEQWPEGARFELVTASFLHAPPGIDLPRTQILRRAAELVAPGGRLLIVTHAAAPPWADEWAHEHRFLSPEDEVAELALDDAEWTIEVCETRPRDVTTPEGEPAKIDDGVVLARRRG